MKNSLALVALASSLLAPLNARAHGADCSATSRAMLNAKQQLDSVIPSCWAATASKGWEAYDFCVRQGIQNVSNMLLMGGGPVVVPMVRMQCRTQVKLYLGQTSIGTKYYKGETFEVPANDRGAIAGQRQQLIDSCRESLAGVYNSFAPECEKNAVCQRY